MADAARLWPRFWVLVALTVIAFLIVGGDTLASSSRAVLHGLCAQRPSHSFTIGGQILPFDARMTGIYTGALWTWLVLLARGRLLAAATPPGTVIAVLGAAVGALAVDGFNALSVDLGVWHPYEPMNEVRFFTGFGTGVALVSLAVWLIGGTLWRVASRASSWAELRQLSWVIPTSLATFGVITLDAARTYPIVASLLLLSAWATVSALALVIVATALGFDRRATSLSRLELLLILSALAGLAIIVALAQLRFWLERSLGIPQDFEPVAAAPLGHILEGLSSIARGVIAA